MVLQMVRATAYLTFLQMTIIFKVVSLKQLKQFFSEGDCSTLTNSRLEGKWFSKNVVNLSQ